MVSITLENCQLSTRVNKAGKKFCILDYLGGRIVCRPPEGKYTDGYYQRITCNAELQETTIDGWRRNVINVTRPVSMEPHEVPM